MYVPYEIVEAVKNVLLFILAILAGWWVSGWIGKIAERLFRRAPLSLDRKMKEAKLDDAIGHLSLSMILGRIIKYVLFTIVLSQVASYFYLGVISTMLNTVVLFVPRLIAAILIVLVTLIGADFITDKIRATKNKIYDMVGIVLEPVLIVFGVIIAGQQLGLDLSFIITLIISVITALTTGLALAFGLAFGLGFGLEKDRQGRQVLPQRVQKIWKKIK